MNPARYHMEGTARVLALLMISLMILAGAFGCKKRPRRRPLPPNAGLTGGTVIFEENFAGGLEKWEAKSTNWKIVDGQLYTGDRPNNNKGIWLKEPALPADVRIEFTARSTKGKKPVFEGDLKCEFGGDKKEHASGYIIILGGWKNTVNTIAKHDEHGKGRLAVDSKVKVEEDKVYRFQVVRLGDEVKWFLDGKLLLKVKDKEPLVGTVFGFNNWNSRAYFDNLKVFAL